MINKKILSFIVICVTVLAPLLFIATPEASANFPKGSQIAGEYIDGKTDQEVRDVLDDAITTWQEEDNLIVKSEYEVFELPRTAFMFDIDATLAEFKDKTKRKLTSFFIKPKNVKISLHVKLDPSNDAVQQMKNIDYINTDETFTSATRIASELEEGDISIVYTDEDAIPFKTISEVTIDLEELTDTTFIESLKELDEHKIQANDSFSFIQQTNYDERSKTRNKEASSIAGEMYHLFLQTNFQIAERHTHDRPPRETKPGLDAMIDIEEGKDLVVVNPNDISFIFNVQETDDEELSISLKTAYHKYSYNVELEEKEIEPRTVYRYDEDLEYGEEKLIQQGVPGTSVIVERSMYNESNDLRHTEFISHDIYTLIPTIILVSTTDEETAQEETVEEQVDVLEDTISEFEEELSEVREDAAAHAEANGMIVSLAEQLEDIQQQQAECMQLIIDLQEQMDRNQNSSDDFNDLYDNLEERLTTIDEQLDALEEKMNGLE